MSSGSFHVIASLVKVLGFLLSDGMANVEHYKMVVLRERGPWQPTPAVQGRGRRGSRGRHARGVKGDFRGEGVMGAMETYLCFWCQSAGVCFSEIGKEVHSIILTSGEKIRRQMSLGGKGQVGEVKISKFLGKL